MSVTCDDDTKISLNPSSFRYMNVRTLNVNPWVGSGGSTGFQADWFMIGNSSHSYANQLTRHKVIRNKALQNIVDKNIFFRMNMCRYNHGTNLSNIVGYFQDTDTLINAPGMQGWRGVPLNKTPTTTYGPPFPSRIYLKNISDSGVHKGILLDISNATIDANDSVSSPIYPSSYNLTISQSGDQIISQNIEVETLLKQQAGIIFIQDSTKILADGVPIDVNVDIKITVDAEEDHNLAGTEPQFVFNMSDAAIKNQLSNTGSPMNEAVY